MRPHEARLRECVVLENLEERKSAPKLNDYYEMWLLHKFSVLSRDCKSVSNYEMSGVQLKLSNRNRKELSQAQDLVDVAIT